MRWGTWKDYATIAIFLACFDILGLELSAECPCRPALKATTLTPLSCGSFLKDCYPLPLKHVITRANRDLCSGYYFTRHHLLVERHQIEDVLNRARN